MLDIEFRYYDKTNCDRCASTEKAIKQTLRELKSAIKDMRQPIAIKEKRLPASKLHLSPSIIINGRDIERIVSKGSKPKTNECKDCCRLAGKPVACRTFTYKGRAYDHIPKGMIMDAIRISARLKA
jgi:hypothetical protein